MGKRIPKYCWALSLLLLVALSAHGQTTTARLLEFEQPTRETGTIRKDADPIVFTFKYTNIADNPVVIKDIHTRCGCLKPEFDTKPVAPGESAQVRAVLDPGILYGDFKVPLTVIASNGDYNKYSTLVVQGTVVGDVSFAEVKYPYVYSGAIRADKRAVGMRLISSRKRVVTAVMEMYNGSDRDAEIVLSHDNKFLKVQSPVTIPAGKAVEIPFALDPKRLPEGEFTIPVRPVIDGVDAERMIEVRGAVETK